MEIAHMVPWCVFRHGVGLNSMEKQIPMKVEKAVKSVFN